MIIMNNRRQIKYKFNHHSGVQICLMSLRTVIREHLALWRPWYGNCQWFYHRISLATSYIAPKGVNTFDIPVLGATTTKGIPGASTSTTDTTAVDSSSSWGTANWTWYVADTAIRYSGRDVGLINGLAGQSISGIITFSFRIESDTD